VVGRELTVMLDADLPARLPIGQGNALFVRGSCRHASRHIAALRVVAGNRDTPVLAHGMPLPDHPPGAGFLAILPFEDRTRPGPTEIRIVATLAGGGAAEETIGAIELSPGLGEAETIVAAARHGARVAICMATHDPPPDLFDRQIESIRSQTREDWLCLISDDASAPERLAAIRDAIEEDPRFLLFPSSERLGFYRNFERALAMVPGDVPYVALADQDDRWDPRKLEVLLEHLGDARLVYSDARAIRPDGEVIARSLWTRRRNNRTNLASLLFSNTVTGAASLFRRELLELALPFPPAPGRPYHDHWLALVALVSGELAYVQEPLFDYVQHPGAVIGYEAISAQLGPGVGERLRRLLADPSAALPRWREAYLDEYCRTLLFALVLRMRCASLLTPAKRRALDLFLAGERSPRTLGWLAVRPLRALTGHNETMRFEHRLLRGLVWRNLVSARSRLRAGRPRAASDGGIPPPPP
jgi:glycosyltransferase involved in cell wall biosynthesis